MYVTGNDNYIIDTMFIMTIVFRVFERIFMCVQSALKRNHNERISLIRALRVFIFFSYFDIFENTSIIFNSCPESVMFFFYYKDQRLASNNTTYGPVYIIGTRRGARYRVKMNIFVNVSLLRRSVLTIYVFYFKSAVNIHRQRRLLIT